MIEFSFFPVGLNGTPSGPNLPTREIPDRGYHGPRRPQQQQHGSHSQISSSSTDDSSVMERAATLQVCELRTRRETIDMSADLNWNIINIMNMNSMNINKHSPTVNVISNV